MPMFTMYRVKVEQIILFGKIVNQYFERKAFRLCQFWRFDGGSLRIKASRKLCTCELFIQSILQATQATIYLTTSDNGY